MDDILYETLLEKQREWRCAAGNGSSRTMSCARQLGLRFRKNLADVLCGWPETRFH